MVRFRITVKTHGFSVKVMFHQDKKIMSDFCGSLEVYETRYNLRLKRSSRVFKMTFSTYISRTETYGLHRGLYQDFLEHLKRHQVSDREVEIILLEAHPGAPSNLVLSDIANPRDHQGPIVDWIVKGGSTLVLPLQTGKGKTFCTLYSIAIMGVRSAIVMGAKHVATWLKDAKWIYKNAAEEIIVVQGKDDLMDVIELAKNNQLDKSILIFTTDTIRNYLTEYEGSGHSSYGCTPSELYSVLKIGFRATDEAHENLHFGFRQDIETNVMRALYLSATINSHDSFINRMYGVIFPIVNRYTGLKWDKYIAVKAIGYTLRDARRVKCIGSMGYSHVKFEQSIMKDREMLANYLNMVKVITIKGFTDTYQDGQKFLIYMSTVEMCERTAEYLNRAFEGLFKAHPYTSDHDDNILTENDIIVSTPIKSGSGKDIKGLVTVLATVAVNAKEKNQQMVGRLRVLDDQYPGVEPVFYYLVCLSIPKHIQYHKARMEIFAPVTKSIHSYRSAFSV